jgi:hypothetical protein
MTSALDGGEWSASRPGRTLPPGKGPPVPIVQEAGWAQRLEEKSFRLCRGSNLDRPVVQPVARHYTDWATRLTNLLLLENIPSLSPECDGLSIRNVNTKYQYEMAVQLNQVMHVIYKADQTV